MALFWQPLMHHKSYKSYKMYHNKLKYFGNSSNKDIVVYKK